MRPLSLSLSHPHSLSLCNFSGSPSTQLAGRAFPAISPLLFVFVFAFSSSSSYLLPLCTSFLFFFTSASSSCCFSSLLSSSSHGLPAQLLGGVNVGSRTKDLSSNVALCCVVLRRWEWSSAFRFHDVLSFQVSRVWQENLEHWNRRLRT